MTSHHLSAFLSASSASEMLRKAADAVLNEMRNPASTPVSASPGGQEGHLKYENDRLKIALAQSSANAKKWEIELQTLKNNNARLTTALQESTANVEEWKKQLAMYKEESARMKKRVIEMEKGGGNDANMQAQVGELNTKVSQLEITAQSKDIELGDLRRQLDILRPLEAQNKQLLERTQHFESENKCLQGHVDELQAASEKTRQTQQREKQQVRGLHEQLRNKITELYTLQDQVTSLLKS